MASDHGARMPRAGDLLAADAVVEVAEGLGVLSVRDVLDYRAYEGVANVRGSDKTCSPDLPI